MCTSSFSFLSCTQVSLLNKTDLPTRAGLLLFLVLLFLLRSNCSGRTLLYKMNRTKANFNVLLSKIPLQYITWRIMTGGSEYLTSSPSFFSWRPGNPCADDMQVLRADRAPSCPSSLSCRSSPMDHSEAGHCQKVHHKNSSTLHYTLKNDTHNVVRHYIVT